MDEQGGNPAMVTRRDMIGGFAAAVGAASLPTPAFAQTGLDQRRAVSVVFQPTGETFRGLYADNGQYLIDGILRFSKVVRDHRANKVKVMHPRLMDILFVLHWRYHVPQIVVTSGYRTRETNSRLEGAARNSYHIKGLALDIHVPDLDNTAIGKDLATFLPGGVGIYPGRGFTHFDLGDTRRWRG